MDSSTGYSIQIADSMAGPESAANNTLLWAPAGSLEQSTLDVSLAWADIISLGRHQTYGTAGKTQLCVSDDTQHCLVVGYPPIQTAITNIEVCLCVQ